MKRILTICVLLLLLTAVGCSNIEEAITTGGNTSSDAAQNSSELVTTGTHPVTATETSPAVSVPAATATTTAPVTTEPSATESSTTVSTVTEPSTTASVATEPSTTKPATAAPEPTTNPPATAPSPTVTTAPASTAAATTEPEASDAPPTVDFKSEQFQADPAIIYAVRPLTLYLDDGEAVSMEADTAMIRTGVGKSLARVRWQGRIGYVRLEDTTEERPKSALDLAAEKGGIYYKGKGPLIAIDAGHQDHSMKDKEPLGPGSDELKAKLSSGTQGVATRLEEYKLNLAVALLLRDELIERGYSVVMIRETNNVEMSNAERALIANGYGADAFIRIHANGSEDKSVTGAYTLCPTASNPYNGDLYPECKRLSEIILDKYIDSTGFVKKSIWYTDTMTGLNWAAVPVTLIEMGYMSNPDEDRTMATEEFQKAAAIGMADGFDLYFGRV